MKTIKNLAIIAVFVSTFIACSNDDPDPVVEQELITTITATLTPNGGGTVVILKSVDLDGDGPNPPVINPTNAVLAANTTYNGVLKVENETEDPAEDVTLEVLDLDEEHQFFFTATNNIATVTYDDMDGDGNPIGVEFTLVTTAASSGNLTITLRHEPMKSATGVSEGDITNAGGETDVQATFAITVQ
ncbi:type 1 periplasmic binding fold superfamily protein [uncultured Polaribacter sp.]|uniref:type 1 periplasmic binding fold superfamily protein n=1 Tax=uncultured Polaribacter sp. TaxID=174711 RepID=UPI002630A269|nr:type 1 periplasmic binding fold superfamily protein [uncultured Polaribacter sp.]